MNEISARSMVEERNNLLSSIVSDPELNYSQENSIFTENVQDEAMIAAELSITCNESEKEYVKGRISDFRLNTITEERTSAISILDESENCNHGKTTNAYTTEEYTETSETMEFEEESTMQLVDEGTFFKSSLFELGRRLWKSTHDEQHFTKGCLWSPDGTCLLVPVHLDGMHVMELPRDLYNTNDINFDREVSNLETAVHVKEGGTVYDYSWYPFMRSELPETCCWLATRQHEPIHLWDAFTGELRCSYRGYDAVDEVEAAISVIFSNDGEKVIGGYKKSIKIFDTNIPGRDYLSVPVKKAVSCFAFTQQSELTVTTGSWKGYIDYYDLRTPKLGSLFTLGHHTGGITWLKFSKSEPVMLFSGARRDNKLLQWDMRNYKQPLREFNRGVKTNQRIYFDLSPQEEWLVSGDCSGLLQIWNLKDPDSKVEAVPLHSDCCNGVSFHPTLPFLATTAGQYHFVDVTSDEVNTSNNVEREIVHYENSVLLLLMNALELEK